MTELSGPELNGCVKEHQVDAAGALRHHAFDILVNRLLELFEAPVERLLVRRSIEPAPAISPVLFHEPRERVQHPPAPSRRLGTGGLAPELVPDLLADCVGDSEDRGVHAQPLACVSAEEPGPPLQKGDQCRA